MERKLFYSGSDSGCGLHFREIGQKFHGIELAILENGQYNTEWAQIHTLSAELPQICRDLGAKEVITVHHSKYALSKYPCDEPQRGRAGEGRRRSPPSRHGQA